jgi:hypothetical protein
MTIALNYNPALTIDGVSLISDKPHAAYVDVTPALASQLLLTSPGNRRLRDWYVDLLATIMKRGDWMPTNKGVGIDRLGRVRDAHHTLTACVKSGVTIKTLVCWGLDENVYEVIDRGLIRDYGDILGVPRNIADVLRLGCSLVTGSSRPTPSEMKPYMAAGLLDAVEALNHVCSSKVKYFSSAPMRLAACVTIMNGGDTDYVYEQYKALVLADYDSMSNASKALTRQVQGVGGHSPSKVRGADTRDTIARGLRVFDQDRAGVSKIQVSQADQESAVEFVKSVLRNSVSHGRS